MILLRDACAPKRYMEQNINGFFSSHITHAELSWIPVMGVASHNFGGFSHSAACTVFQGQWVAPTHCKCSMLTTHNQTVCLPVCQDRISSIFLHQFQHLSLNMLVVLLTCIVNDSSLNAQELGIRRPMQPQASHAGRCALFRVNSVP